MLKNEDVQLADVAINTSFPLRTDKHLDMQNVPLYELDATVGLVELFKNSYLYVSVSYLQILNLPPCDGALYVRGDSCIQY